MTEDGWNMRDPESVALDYCAQNPWRNRVELIDEDGLMRRRFALVTDTPIFERARVLLWSLGRRPEDHPSLSALGL